MPPDEQPGISGTNPIKPAPIAPPTPSPAPPAAAEPEVKAADIKPAELKDNLAGFIDVTGDALMETLQGFLRGHKDDLKKFGALIIRNMAAAKAANRPDLVKACRGQVKVLAEAGRLSLRRTTWDFIENTVETLGGFVVKLAAAGFKR